MFPLDLLEATIEFLASQGTLDDLRQCALANKQLARLCQRRIFHTVVLVQKPAPRAVPWDSEERVSLPPHPIERFAEVVKQNPTLGTYVRELEIESMRDSNVSRWILGYRTTTMSEYLKSRTLRKTHGRWISENFSEWTCRGNVLSRLPPPSLNTLRRIALFIDTIDTPELPPYAEFVHELTRLQGENVLEELSISLMCHFDSDLNLDPIRWKELGDLLSLGFPSLRKLTLHVKVGIFDGPSPFEEAARKHWAILERILDEGFALIDPNVESTTSAQCREI
ncbi:hypothetical protein CC1G_03934 [Coprinopsis cinerea okayama7|uniref:Uncharacterized protein n=1 Tax=Coprinopsis cinerea (strain Okayama-7 / 130 / ATCC MYA-4618 / FGSC 9003) TaxID=240176 RepID=A8N887_COPC7|nr:hypothetical protein CC1G_03934 [Coprinopsis cinerea okayama7\|eukprot:XP_001831043.1 hypothetical protein CC1G_03934 [Coprinopsis cinerea okayama7\